MKYNRIMNEFFSKLPNALKPYAYSVIAAIVVAAHIADYFDKISKLNYLLIVTVACFAALIYALWLIKQKNVVVYKKIIAVVGAIFMLAIEYFVLTRPPQSLNVVKVSGNSVYGRCAIDIAVQNISVEFQTIDSIGLIISNKKQKGRNYYYEPPTNDRETLYDINDATVDIYTRKLSASVESSVSPVRQRVSGSYASIGGKGVSQINLTVPLRDDLAPEKPKRIVIVLPDEFIPSGIHWERHETGAQHTSKRAISLRYLFSKWNTVYLSIIVVDGQKNEFYYYTRIKCFN